MNTVKALKLFSLILAVLVLAGCVQPESEPQTLVSTDTLKIVVNGRETTVSDLAGQQQYKFITQRIKRTEAPTEPHQAIKTDTICIDIYPGAVLRITDYTAQEVYEITPKRGCLNGKESF